MKIKIYLNEEGLVGGDSCPICQNEKMTFFPYRLFDTTFDVVYCENCLNGFITCVYVYEKLKEKVINT